MSELALYETAKEALATAVRIDEVTDILDAAARAKAYAKISKDRRLVADAQELIDRAERKLGIMLRQVREGGLLSSGGRPRNSNLDEPETGADAEPVFDATSFTLEELGVSKKLSSRAQQRAALDEEAFEEEIIAKRDKIIAGGAATVSAPKVIKVAAPKVDKPQALEPRRFHQFAFSMIAMCVSSDRVSSEALLFFAAECGVIERDGDEFDFTPEALAAFGSLADVARKAITRTRELPLATTDVTPTPSDVTAALELREAYAGEVALLLPSKGKLTMATAEAAMRAGYAARVAVILIAQDFGHPLGTIKTWANRLGLTDKARMIENQQRFGGEQ